MRDHLNTGSHPTTRGLGAESHSCGSGVIDGFLVTPKTVSCRIALITLFWCAFDGPAFLREASFDEVFAFRFLMMMRLAAAMKRVLGRKRILCLSICRLAASNRDVFLGSSDGGM